MLLQHKITSIKLLISNITILSSHYQLHDHSAPRIITFQIMIWLGMLSEREQEDSSIPQRPDRIWPWIAGTSIALLALLNIVIPYSAEEGS